MTVGGLLDALGISRQGAVKRLEALQRGVRLIQSNPERAREWVEFWHQGRRLPVFFRA